MKKVIKASNNASKKDLRVIQLSFDIVTDDTIDSDDIRRIIGNDIDVKGEEFGFRLAGSDFVDDLTEIYEAQYPDVISL